MKYIEKIIPVAKGAGEILLSYRGSFKESSKATLYDVGSVVTSADFASEAFIVNGINKSIPYHGIFSEEGTSFRLDSEEVWYVDPLDGTASFIRGFPFYGVSIGLMRNNKAVAGVLHFPELDLTVWAEEGEGAYANGRPIRVSNLPLNKALYYGGGSWKGEFHTSLPLVSATGQVQILSASAYELAQIAMGSAEIYLLVSNPIDVVAGACIVAEAGGKVTTASGQEWGLKSETILVTNGVVHEETLEILRNNPYPS
ncbi:MAG: inositol monophosphatase [Patescibacteria group bacterium]